MEIILTASLRSTNHIVRLKTKQSHFKKIPKRRHPIESTVENGENAVTMYSIRLIKKHIIEATFNFIITKINYFNSDNIMSKILPLAV